jgi:hypothetical protein
VSQPYTPPPPTVSYRVSIGSEEWIEYKTPVNSSKYVADNIYAGYSAQVVFENAANLALVRDNFNKRIDDWLKQLGHSAGFFCEPTQLGASYRLTE